MLDGRSNNLALVVFISVTQSKDLLSIELVTLKVRLHFEKPLPGMDSLHAT